MKLYIVYRDLKQEGEDVIAYFTNKIDAELAIDDLTETKEYWSDYEIKIVNVNEHSKFLRLRVSKYSVLGSITDEVVYVNSIRRLSFFSKLEFTFEKGKVTDYQVRLTFTASSLKWAKRKAHDEIKKQAKKAGLLNKIEPKQT